ncbi:protein lin-37 homolog [Venturia canescens]|uniref:protein lin-37 homolog n=1 Tax=Venturia canescens TaxID=32260 RepID=UPI001C9C3D04|nr:protein lin-37 homolog [Venturia canescens]XP_043282609.1 protein lin-37 homolog [Venturia canescens]
MGKRRIMQNSATPTRSVKIEIKDEFGDNDVLVARDRLKGALREILHHSDEASSADDSEESTIQEYKLQVKKIAALYKGKPPNYQQTRKTKRRRQLPIDPAFHHTYVMKLFDRSVDLAQFKEDTPLYPICRAWIANQPRNPNLVPKVRSASPEIVNEENFENLLNATSGEIRDIHLLPPPLQPEEAFPRNRVPSPISQGKEDLNLDYEGQILKTRETLLEDHRTHWSAVKKKWHQQSHKNEQRFAQSGCILSTIFKRAQSEFE